MSAAVAIFVVVAGYLLGSLSGSLLLGRWRGIDIRTQGSGNAGGTNAFRTQGALFALGVVVIDIGKGAAAAALGLAVDALPLALAAGFAAAIGHVYPVFHGLRGGKGAAVVVGVIAVVFPIALLPLLGIWLLVLGTAGYVGPGTVLAGLLLPVCAVLLAAPGARAPLLVWSVAVAALLTFTHRANLARWRAGTEHRFERARVLRRVFGSRGSAP